jgi:two-component system chemotaxis response regulator CheB
LLRNLPADLGVAIVIVNHLRTVATRLHEILPRYTAMPVELITERLLIRPNHVFIIPAHRDLHVRNGEFHLEPISKPWGWPDVITVFLKSLTQHWHGQLVAVIVSGYDGDGAAALCGINEVGGITIAQKLDTAGQPDMPESAIASGCVDLVLSPEDIARELARIARPQRLLHNKFRTGNSELPPAGDLAAMGRLLFEKQAASAASPHPLPPGRTDFSIFQTIRGLTPSYRPFDELRRDHAVEGGTR